MPSSPSTSNLSDTLQQITLIKIAELDKKHQTYDARKRQALDYKSIEIGGSKTWSRTSQLAGEIPGTYIPFIDHAKLQNIISYLQQASVDPSVTETEISRYEQWLLAHLDYQSNRLDHATLFSAVLSEHLGCSSETSTDQSEGMSIDDDSLDGPFEMLTRDRLQQLREKFEDVVFNELKTDEQAIHAYLESLFPDEQGKRIIEGLRGRFNRDTTAIFEKDTPFDEDVLDWVISGLLHNDLLRDDQKSTLKSFQTDDLVRAEICDVLNMRWAELRTWQWTEDGSGLDVEPRKQLNGKYRVVMQEDVLQSMLVHYIGVKLCVNAKEELKYWLEETMDIKGPLSGEQRDRVRFYRSTNHEDWHPGRNLVKKTIDDHWSEIFLSQLPDTVGDFGGYEDDEDDEDDGKSAADKQKSWLQVKQQLLRHVASRILIDRKLHGDVAVVQTDLQWFATSIPHSTVYAVLKFCGLSDEWLRWFRAYLEVPLNTTKAAGEEQQTRRRKRGIPIAHALEKYLGEMILVFLDVAVRRESNLLLYRMHDDIMLCGPTKQCEQAWATMQKFVKLMGLEFNKKKTGSISLNATGSQKAQLPDGDVTVDFLKLSHDRGLWVIDNENVNAHIKQLKEQLDESQDILSFIRTYNSCIGRFFGHTFGLPAHCLGPKHVEDILQTHQRIQKELFGEDGITAVLKDKLETLARKEGLSEDFRVSDSFIHSPNLLGGLGVVNPFIPLLLVQDDLKRKDPEQRVNEWLESEKTSYNDLKRKFESETFSIQKTRLMKILGGSASSKGAENNIDCGKYWSFEEWMKHPEWTSKELMKLYEELMKSPSQSDVLVSSRVKEDLERLTARGAKQVSLEDLTVEERYKVEMFSEEVFDKFGTVAIVDRTLAPLGVMKAVLGEKVTWQMVL